MILPSVTTCECLLAECKTTHLGREYMGTMTTTAGGYTCRPWTQGSPFTAATVDSNFPERSIAAASNYCRNPDTDPGGPWCHPTDPKKYWDYCAVPLCPGKCIYFGVYA